MHDGKVANFEDMNAMFEKRCTQFAELEKAVASDPDNAELTEEMKKVKAQGEVIQSKLRTLACQDEKILKDTFESVRDLRPTNCCCLTPLLCCHVPLCHLTLPLPHV